MRKTFAILLASTALAVGAGIPAWSAMHGDARPETSCDQAAGYRANLMLASDDDGVDRHHGRRIRHGDDDDRHDEDDEDDDDDGHGSGASAGPAPAGIVAPPANGLFGNGTMPKVKVN